MADSTSGLTGYFRREDQDATRTLDIRFVEYVDMPPSAALSVEVVGPEWTEQRLLDEIDALVHEEGGYLGHPFSVDRRAAYLSWGADAQSWTVVLQLAEWAAQGVIGAVALNMVGKASALGRRFARSSRLVEESSYAKPLTHDEALQRLLLRLDTVYDLGLPNTTAIADHTSSDGGIHVTREEQLGDSAWSFEIDFREGTYWGTVELLGDYATVTLVGRGGADRHRARHA